MKLLRCETSEVHWSELSVPFACGRSLDDDAHIPPGRHARRAGKDGFRRARKDLDGRGKDAASPACDASAYPAPSDEIGVGEKPSFPRDDLPKPLIFAAGPPLPPAAADFEANALSGVLGEPEQSSTGGSEQPESAFQQQQVPGQLNVQLKRIYIGSGPPPPDSISITAGVSFLSGTTGGTFSADTQCPPLQVDGDSMRTDGGVATTCLAYGDPALPAGAQMFIELSDVSFPPAQAGLQGDIATTQLTLGGNDILDTLFLFPFRLNVVTGLPQVGTGTGSLAYETVEDSDGSVLDCARLGGSEQWALCWQTCLDQELQGNGRDDDCDGQVDEPRPPPRARLCATWNASYLDEGFGEDGTAANIVTTPEGQYGWYRASYARYWLTAEGPLGEIPADEPMMGFLDADGCVEVDGSVLTFEDGALPGEEGGLELTLTIDGNVERSDGVSYSMIDTAGHGVAVTFTSTVAGNVPLDTWTLDGGVRVPPPEIVLNTTKLTDMTGVAASVSRILAAPDLAIAPGSYGVRVGDGCPFTIDGRTVISSCSSGSDLLIGPPTEPLMPATCTTSADCPGVQGCYQNTQVPCPPGAIDCRCAYPDDSHWKFVIAHEAGHAVQELAMGEFAQTGYSYRCPPGMTCNGVTVNSGYIDPPSLLLPSLCGCQHVQSTQGLHCLQSIERGGAAQGEGFAQFFAARVWNTQEEDDCTFVYYKDFLDYSCTPGTSIAEGTCAPFGTEPATLLPLFTSQPPAAVDCREQVKWRNNFCPMGSEGAANTERVNMGTEYDWMNYFYNLNTTGTLTSTMADIWSIYRASCNPAVPSAPCSGSEVLGWATLPVQPVAVPPDGSPLSCTVGGGECAVAQDSACRESEPPGGNVECSATSPDNDDDGLPDCECKSGLVLGLMDGINVVYAADQSRRDRAIGFGDDYGVSTNLSP